MKLILSLSAALLFSAAGLASNEKPLESAIDHVVVYQQGAQVERIADFNFSAGRSALVFTDLNTAIDPAQLRVTGNGEFTVLSISHRYHTDTLSGGASAAAREALQRDRNEKSKAINRLNARRVIYDREESLLLNNQNFTVKDSGVDLARLMEADAFFRERFMAVLEGRQEIDLAIETLNEEIQALDRQMGQLPQLRTATSLEVLVNIEAEGTGKGKLLLSYWMANAGWTPSYNARVEDITDPLKLEYQAMVHQNTNEDWEDVSMSIATGTPSKNRTKPTLQPRVLDGAYNGRPVGPASANAWLRAQPYNPNVNQVRGQLYDAQGSPLVGARVVAQGTNVSTVTDINGFYTMAVPTNSMNISYSAPGYTVESLAISNPVMNVALAPAQLDEVMVVADMAEESLFGGRERRRDDFSDEPAMNFAAVQVGHSPTSTRFDIGARHDIPSDGKPHAVRIKDHAIPVEYLYQVTPKLDPQVYLTAHFTDWESLDLLDGRMHIYFEDDYVGESQLQLNFVEDTLSISLGPDPGIQVRRKRIERENNSNLLSGRHEYIRAYEFSITNRKRAEIHIEVEDQLPLANNEEIEITATKSSGAKIDEETGLVVWDLEIPAGKTEEWVYRYEVRSPRELPLSVD